MQLAARNVVTMATFLAGRAVMPRAVSAVCALLLPACAASPGVVPAINDDTPQALYEERPPSWFEHLTDTARVSVDGRTAIYGTGGRVIGIDLSLPSSGRTVELGAVERAVFGPRGRLARLMTASGVRGWYVEGDESPLPLSPDAWPKWSPDGTRVVTIDARNRTAGVEVDGEPYSVPGHLLSVEWTPDGRRLVTTTRGLDDSVTLGLVDLGTRAFHVVAADLDADVFPAQLAVTPDGRAVVLSLVSGVPASPAVRHDPLADRDLDLWRLDLETGEKTLIIEQPGDDVAPSIVSGHLFWTHAVVRPEVVVVPIAGGEPRVIVSPGELPYWRPDGGQIGFTVGGWRLRDVALPLDAHVVDVDASARATGAPRSFIAGYHEDFSPTWSPIGRWIAYHSHRSPTPVTSYFGSGSTDDIWIRPVDGSAGDERRLTDFGREAGTGDWSPDGRQYAFVTYDAESPSALQAWVVTIDPVRGIATGRRKLRLPPGATTAETLAWAPDGRWIAIESKAGPGTHALWLVSVRDQDGRFLIEYPTTTFGGVDWTPDGRSLVYGALEGERMQLHAVEVETGRTRVLTRATTNLFMPQVSPNGRWVAATSMDHVRRILRQPWK